MGTLQKTTEPNIKRKREFLYGEISYKINGILIEVFKELGAYAREKQYSNLTEEKFKERGIKFEREVLIGDSGNILDYIVEGKIVLELKAKPFLTKEHFDQVKRYLHQTNLKLGILVNFRTNYLNPQRVLNPRYQ